MVCREMRRLAMSGKTVDLGMMRYTVYAVLRVWFTRCMLYSVLTVDHGMERYIGKRANRL